MLVSPYAVLSSGTASIWYTVQINLRLFRKEDHLTLQTFSGIVFLAAMAVIYRFSHKKLRLPVLLAASIACYAMFSLQMLGMLAAAVAISYVFAICIEKAGAPGAPKKLLLAAALIIHFGELFVFKYFGFFTGIKLDLVMPVGISFYTFMICGYLIDVYRGKVRAERNPAVYAAFICFFPQVASGPIGRADSLIPQIKAAKTPERADIREGALLFCWGLFLKMVLADNLGILVDSAYAAPEDVSGLALLIAAMAYSLQIYCDFAGYSMLAFGAGRLFGIRLIENFHAPYLSLDSREFWRRWHISLSTWFRDYLYFPLGGSLYGNARRLLNVMIVFTVSGLWHGAAVTFVIWGALNGVYQVIGILTDRQRTALHKALHLHEDGAVLKLWRRAVTFILMTAAWIFFRADNIDHALSIYRGILELFEGTGAWTMSLDMLGAGRRLVTVIIAALIVLLVVDLAGEKKPLRERLTGWKWFAAVTFMLCVIFIFGCYGPGFDAQEFVYFRF